MDALTLSFQDRDVTDPLGRVGPKNEIVMAQEQICTLFSNHLNKTVQDIKYLKRGYNNLIYLVSTDDGGEFVLKIAGRSWPKIKTETEVVGLTMVQTFTTVPVPKVHAWSSNTEEFGVEYLVLEKLPGLPLDMVWNTLTLKQKLQVLSQLASHLVQFKTSPEIKDLLSSRGNLMGNFIITDPSDILGSFQISENAWLTPGKGPFKSYREFIVAVLAQKIESLERNPDGLFLKHQYFLPRLRKLRDSVTARNSRITDTNYDQFVFGHRDLTKSNVLVTLPIGNLDEPVQISAILDWEWCGPQVPEEEFYRFNFLRLPKEPGGDCDWVRREAFDPVLEDYFYKRLEGGGVITPRLIPHMPQRQALRLVREAIVPWHLTNLRKKNSWRERGRIKYAVRDSREQILSGLFALRF